MEQRKVLLVGAKKKILKGLAEVLEGEDGLSVKWTASYKKVVDKFWDDKFDLIAFGKGVSVLEKDKIKGVFSTKNRQTIFVDGMAPIIPLLAYQVRAGFNKEIVDNKRLVEFKIKKDSEIKLSFELNEKSHIKIVQYYMDFWYRTYTHYFLNTDLNQGKYSITVEKKKKHAFLVIDVNEEEIYIKEI